MNYFINDTISHHRGLAYGDGFFTTMSVVKGQIFFANQHLWRLQSHATALSLHINVNEIMQIAHQQAQILQEGILKIIISRQTQQNRGYGFLTTEANIYINQYPMILNYHNNIQKIPKQPTTQAVCLSQQISCMPTSLVGLKTLNRLENVLLATELQQIKQQLPNVREGLVKNIMGHWVEGVSSNFFYQLASMPNQWFTPPIQQSGVNGVMRQVIMKAMLAQSIPINERILLDIDLSELTALCFCNAVRGMMPMDTLWLGLGDFTLIPHSLKPIAPL